MDMRIEKNFRHKISKAEKTPPFLFAPIPIKVSHNYLFIIKVQELGSGS